MAHITGQLRRVVSSPLAIGVAVCGVGYIGYRNFSADTSSSVDGQKYTFPRSGFTTLVLEESHMVNHNVKRLKFRLPDHDQQSGILPITSLLTQHTPKGAWVPVFRPYTPIDADEPRHLSFLVKRYPNGKGSGHMHALKPGDELKVKPIHEFDYKPNQYSHLIILAGGAGITPFVQLIRRVLGDPTDQTVIRLIISNHCEDDVLLASEFQSHAANSAGRCQITHVITQPKPGTGVDATRGHITKALIEQALPPIEDWTRSKVLVCGPPPFTEAVAGKKGFFGWTQGNLGGMLKEIGLETGHVQKF